MVLTMKTGGLIAAGITYKTAQMDSTWAWRIPSAVQGGFSIICILILPFIPESPRWLVYMNRPEAALEVLGQTYANGNKDDVVVQAQFKEIVDTLDYEKNVGETLSMMEIVKTPSARKRTILASSAAIISTIAGKWFWDLISSWKRVGCKMVMLELGTKKRGALTREFRKCDCVLLSRNHAGQRWNNQHHDPARDSKSLGSSQLNGGHANFF